MTDGLTFAGCGRVCGLSRAATPQGGPPSRLLEQGSNTSALAAATLALGALISFSLFFKKLNILFTQLNLQTGSIINRHARGEEKYKSEYRKRVRIGMRKLHRRRH